MMKWRLAWLRLALVVDDEETVRAVTARTLESLASSRSSPPMGEACARSRSTRPRRVVLLDLTCAHGREERIASCTGSTPMCP